MGNIYIGVDNISRKIKNAYIGVDGIARKIKQFYIGDENGIARLVYSGGGYAFIKNINNLSYIVKADSTLTESYSTQLSTYFPYGGYLYKTGIGYCAVGAPSTSTGNTTIYSINDLMTLTSTYETGYSLNPMYQFFANEDIQMLELTTSAYNLYYSTDHFITKDHIYKYIEPSSMTMNISYNNGKVAFTVNSNNAIGFTHDLGSSSYKEVYLSSYSSTNSVGNGVAIWTTQDRYSVIYNYSTGSTTKYQNIPLMGGGYVNTNNTFYQCFVNGKHMLMQYNAYNDSYDIGVFSSVDGTSWNAVKTYTSTISISNTTAGFSGKTFYICTYNSSANTTTIALTTDCGVTWNEYTVTGMVKAIAEMQ